MTEIRTRLDRGFYTQPMIAGVGCTGLYVAFTTAATKAVQHRVTEAQGNALGVVMAVAAAVFLVGSFLRNERVAFRLELGALLVIIAGYVVVDLAVELTLVQQATAFGAFAVWVQIGSIRLAWALWKALRE